MMVIFITLSFFPFQAFAGTKEKPSSLVVTRPPEPVEGTEMRALLNRVEVSNTLDKSTLRSNEKKNAQVDRREEGRHHRHGGGVVYISAGSVVLVILLVLILM